MSDLIRRKDVIKLVNQFVFGVRKEQIYEAKKTFIKYIEKMPTAYDVEKVVAELEKELGNAQMEYTLGNYNLDNDIGNKIIENYRQDMNEGKCFALGGAIDIVRKGGVE